MECGDFIASVKQRAEKIKKQRQEASDVEYSMIAHDGYLKRLYKNCAEKYKNGDPEAFRDGVVLGGVVVSNNQD